MTESFTKVRRWAVSAAVAAALGFGGVQALATPAAAEEPRACQDDKCKRMCQAQGNITGGCIGDRCACGF